MTFDKKAWADAEEAQATLRAATKALSPYLINEVLPAWRDFVTAVVEVDQDNFLRHAIPRQFLAYYVTSLNGTSATLVASEDDHGYETKYASNVPVEFIDPSTRQEYVQRQLERAKADAEWRVDERRHRERARIAREQEALTARARALDEL